MVDPSGNIPLAFMDMNDLLLHLGDVVEGAANVVSDVVEGATTVTCAVAKQISKAVQYILDEIASHQEVAFYVIGPNGIRLPVKIFESRSDDSGIPGLAGFAMNIGGEIHIGPEMATELIQRDCQRNYEGIDLEALGTPITHTPGSPDPEGIMAHEIGHQVDADNYPVLYQTIGLILTLYQGSMITNFEANASNRGEYYGIDWNHTP